MQRYLLPVVISGLILLGTGRNPPGTPVDLSQKNFPPPAPPPSAPLVITDKDANPI